MSFFARGDIFASETFNQHNNLLEDVSKLTNNFSFISKWKTKKTTFIILCFIFRNCEFRCENLIKYEIYSKGESSPSRCVFIDQNTRFSCKKKLLLLLLNIKWRRLQESSISVLARKGQSNIDISFGTSKAQRRFKNIKMETSIHVV